MSLPSLALFYKDGNVVGAGSVNIGWFVDERNVEECLRDALSSASGYYTRVAEEVWAQTWREHISKYFTTIEDLQQYQFIELYDWVIPRDVVHALVFDLTLSSADFVQQLKDGKYKLEDRRKT